MPHVTFIHGIANKPSVEKLLKIWLDALSQDPLGNGDAIDLGSSGFSSSMVYWADVLYENTLEEGNLESVMDLESSEAVAEKVEGDPDMTWRQETEGEEKQLVDSLAAKLSFDVLVEDTFKPAESEIDTKLERIPLPWFVKRRLMKYLLRDVHHYLFNYDFSPRSGTTYKVQEEIRSRMLKAFRDAAAKPGPHIAISHSMGTVILYDCLKRLQEFPPIDALITIGSPLGIDEVQDKLKPEWTRENGFPEKLKGPWVNVYDMLDPVTGFDGNIANDFKKNNEEVVEVINEQNAGAWRHNITNYLSRPKLRAALLKILNS